MTYLRKQCERRVQIRIKLASSRAFREHQGSSFPARRQLKYVPSLRQAESVNVVHPRESPFRSGRLRLSRTSGGRSLEFQIRTKITVFGRVLEREDRQTTFVPLHRKASFPYEHSGLLDISTFFKLFSNRVGGFKESSEADWPEAWLTTAHSTKRHRESASVLRTGQSTKHFTLAVNLLQ